MARKPVIDEKPIVWEHCHRSCAERRMGGVSHRPAMGFVFSGSNYEVMKKFIALAFIFSFCLAVAYRADATSGACSYHGGVNCGAGADSYGKVVCNDGWHNSSVYFGDTDECKISCIPPVRTNCSTEADYAALYTQAIRSGMQYSGGMGGAWGGILATCRNAITQYQNEQSAYQSCLSSQSTQNVYIPPVYDATASCRNQFGLHSVPSVGKSGYCSCESGYSFGSGDQCVLTVSCGSFSHYDSDWKKCFCDKGYTLTNGQCKQADAVCHDILGLNSHSSGSYNPSLPGNMNEVNQYDCYCNNGYVLNSSGDCQVIPKSQMTITQRAKDWASTNGSCTSNPSLTEEELTQCASYKLHPKDYDWRVEPINIPQSQPAYEPPPIAPKVEPTSIKPVIQPSTKKAAEPQKAVRSEVPKQKESSTIEAISMKTAPISSSAPSQEKSPIRKAWNKAKSLADSFWRKIIK